MMRHPPDSLFPLAVSGLGFSVGGERLLSGLSFELEGKGCTAILGPNGSGKTLLLRLCHGMLTPTAGSVRWGEATPVQALPSQAMVFQLPAMLNRSVRANIDYALRLRRIPRDERQRFVQEAVELCGLTEVVGRNARVLSGGERQKLAIARAWVTRPRALLMDEPTSELDPLATREIEAMIQQVVAQGVRVILATHDMNQVRHLADDVLFLEYGRLRAHLSIGDFLNYQGDDTMRDFVAHPTRSGAIP